MGIRGGREGRLDKGDGTSAPLSSPESWHIPNPLLGFLSLCPLVSRWMEASAAVRQKWQAKAVSAGIPWGRQRGGRREHTGGGSTEGRHQDQVPRCYVMGGGSGHPPRGNLHNTWLGPSIALGAKRVICTLSPDWLGEIEGHLSPGVVSAILCWHCIGQMS